MFITSRNSVAYYVDYYEIIIRMILSKLICDINVVFRRIYELYISILNYLLQLAFFAATVTVLRVCNTYIKNLRENFF